MCSFWGMAALKQSLEERVFTHPQKKNAVLHLPPAASGQHELFVHCWSFTDFVTNTKKNAIT